MVIGFESVSDMLRIAKSRCSIAERDNNEASKWEHATHRWVNRKVPTPYRFPSGEKKSITTVPHSPHQRGVVTLSVLCALHQVASFKRQVGQLSQRDRATLRVIEYFAKSLKVIRNVTVAQGVCKSLLVFRWHYVCMQYRFWDIQRQRMAWPWNWG